MKKIPYIDDVKEFNETFGKTMNENPTLVDEASSRFIIDTIEEELNEYKEAVENNDLVEVADALVDMLYFVCNGILKHGLRDKLDELFNEVHSSNMSKACSTEEEAIETVKRRTKEENVEHYYKQKGDRWIVYYRSNDKVRKSVNYREPNLKDILNND